MTAIGAERITLTGTQSGSAKGIDLLAGPLGGANATGSIALVTDTINIAANVESDGALTIKLTSAGEDGGTMTFQVQLIGTTDAFTVHYAISDVDGGR